MASVVFFELNQNRSLIKPNFDGYKLSLDTVPVIKHELSAPPHRARTGEDQYSYLHTELFALHNHLVQDPWDRLSVFFVNTQGSIQKCSYCLETGRPKPPAAVYKLPSTSNWESGDYNVSFRFISEKFCLLCDGRNHIILFDTGDRCRAAEWKVVFKSKISEDRKSFIIRDARLDMTAGEKKINFVLHRIEHETGDGSVSQLFWYVVVQSKDKGWGLELKETFVGKGSLNYCALEPKSGAIILSGNKPFKSISVADEAPPDEKKPEETPKDMKRPQYAWSQTDDDVVIKFVSRPAANKTDYKVVSKGDTIHVKCQDEVLVDGKLFERVDPDLTTWILENNSLQVTLVKNISSHSWAFLVADGPMESVDAQKECAMPLGAPVPNLEAQTEECDDPIQAMEEEYFIERIDLTTRKPTHRHLLGSRAPLFSTCLRPGFPAAIVTRQDVDACLWLLQLNPMKPDEWNLRHEGTLHAIGYVLASKQQKKFVDCSPDLTYTVICESFRHVFIYKSTYDSATTLRNRNGPQVDIGKQHLVTLEDSGEVLGMVVDNVITIILTEKFVLYLQINVE